MSLSLGSVLSRNIAGRLALGAAVATTVFTASGAGLPTMAAAAPARPAAGSPAAVVTGVSPADGPITGGTTVFVIGSGFTSANAVFVGNHGLAKCPAGAPHCFTVDSDSQITLVTPDNSISTPGGSGPVSVDIRVYVNGVPSATGSGDIFTYHPVVTGVSPQSGNAGTSVTVTGHGFQAGSSGAPTGPQEVCFGGTNGGGNCTAATSVSAVSDTQLTAIAPVNLPGTYHVDVVVGGVDSIPNVGDQFTYAAPGPPPPGPPTISTDNGPFGFTAGKTVSLDVSGTTGHLHVFVGNSNCTEATHETTWTPDQVVPNRINVDMPDLAAGKYRFMLQNDNGTSPCNDADKYTYALPQVTDVQPSTGPSQGGQSEEIQGGIGTDNFDANPKSPSKFPGYITFGGFRACGPCDVSVNGGGKHVIVVKNPPHAAGPVTVSATNSAGTSTTNGTFSYFAYRPIVTAVSPNAGPATGGQQVSLTGSNFTAATKVTFGGDDSTGGTDVACPGNCTVVDDTHINVTTPSGSPGTVNVRVTTAGGRSHAADGCTNGTCTEYTYVTPPHIDSISPSSGPTTGGTTVTINGTGFGGADKVTFAGINYNPCSSSAPPCFASSSGAITLNSPAHDPGSVGIVVHTPSGGNSNAATFDYGRNGSHQAIVRNTDGRLEAFALGSDKQLYHNWEGTPSGAFGGWYWLGTAPGLVSDPAAGLNRDGRIEAFAVASNGSLYHIWQTTPGGGWSGYYSLGHPASGALQGVISVATNTDGRLELFARGPEGAIWHMWQTSAGGGWTSQWYSLGLPGGGNFVSDVAAGRNGDGRLEIAAIDGSGALWHSWQTRPSGGWTSFYQLPNTSATGNPAIATNGDGRLEIVYQDSQSAATFDHVWQVTPSGGWGQGYSLGGHLGSDPDIARNGDGRLEVFGLDLQGHMTHAWQTTPGGGWTGIYQLNQQTSVTLTGNPHAAANTDGTLVVLAEDASSATMRESRQVTPSGGWTNWFDQGGSFLPYS